MSQQETNALFVIKMFLIILGGFLYLGLMGFAETGGPVALVILALGTLIVAMLISIDWRKELKV